MGLLSKAVSISSTQEAVPDAGDELLDFCTEYHRNNGACQCLVLETPAEEAAGITGSFAQVRPLSPIRCLMLFPQAKDRELISHRITKTLGVTAALAFEFADPQEALTKLQPYR